jgi:nucleoside 2-deoxyribosyltransferase
MKFNKVKKYYLASPFSHKYKKVMREREKEITRIAAELTYKYGWALFLPITQSAPMERIIPALGGSFERWRDIDLTWVDACDGLIVAMMDGWKDSVGVTEEIRFAEEKGMEIKYIDPQNCHFVTRREQVLRGIEL